MASPTSLGGSVQDTPPMTVRTDDKITTAEETMASAESKRKATAETGQTQTATFSSSSSSPTRLRLADLPNEILSHIIDYLDTDPPSEVNWNERPDTTLTNSKTIDLKTFSRTSTHLRHLVLPRLFAHTRLDPVQSTPFLQFVDRNNLTTHIASLVAHLPGPCTHLHPVWWTRLLTAIPLTTFTILCPPYVLAEFANVSLVNTDSWVFNMPYQSMRLRQDHPALSSSISISTSISTSHLFTARPWTHLSVNESSSLKAYSQYEYFLRKTPSLLASLYSEVRAPRSLPPGLLVPSSPGPSQDLLPSPYTTLLANLTHFTYTAIFPFYNHVETILNSVHEMPRLTHLTFKLCPEPHSTVIDDELKAAQGHIDVHDAWMEFDTAYTLVAQTVIYLTPERGRNGTLEEFRVDDVKMEGIRENLEEVITQRLQEWWLYSGKGVWKRRFGEGRQKQADGEMTV